MAPSGCICGIIGMRFAVPEVGVPDEAAIGRASAATQVLEMISWLVDLGPLLTYTP